MRLRCGRWPGALLVSLLLATACAREPLTVTTIQLGRSVNADRTVTGFTTRFKPTDTIYVALLTEGVGSATVKARWRFGGRVVSEPERKITTQGPASTEFHLTNTSGFPPGDYAVELFLDGTSVGSKSFRVETGDPRTQYTFPNTTPKPRGP